MAFVVCDKHGGQVSLLVCPHLRDDVINRRRIATVIRLDAEYLGDPAWCVHICALCGAQQGFTESMCLPGDEGLDKVFEFDQHAGFLTLGHQFGTFFSSHVLVSSGVVL